MDSHPLDRIRETDPTLAIAHEAMSEAHDAHEWDRVVTLGKAWLEARDGLSPIACVWYANALQAQGDLIAAKQWAIIAVKAIPKDEPDALAAAYGTLAVCEARVGKYANAREAMRKMVSQPCVHPDSMEKQGHTLLTLESEWRKAWEMTEHRLKKPENAFPNACRPWEGGTKEPVALLHEQGIGDTILMSRWIGQLAQDTGHKVTFYGPTMLHRYLAEHPDVVIGNIPDLETAPPQSIAAIKMMSFPYYADLNKRKHIPAPWGPQRLMDQRKMRGNGIKVGVCWKGNKSGWHDFERSIPVEIFKGFWERVDDPVTWINLCHDADVPSDAPFERKVFTDLLETAEEAAKCDIILTVDTSVAHLAGSLGIPTICLVPCAPDWRYTWPAGVTSPWYPSMTVLRPKFMHDPARLDKASAILNGFIRALSKAA